MFSTKVPRGRCAAHVAYLPVGPNGETRKVSLKDNEVYLRLADGSIVRMRTRNQIRDAERAGLGPVMVSVPDGPWGPSFFPSNRVASVSGSAEAAGVQVGDEIERLTLLDADGNVMLDTDGRPVSVSSVEMQRMRDLFDEHPGARFQGLFRRGDRQVTLVLDTADGQAYGGLSLPFGAALQSSVGEGFAPLGFKVTRLDAGSPAELAGLRIGESILGIVGKPGLSVPQILEYVRLHPEGEIAFIVQGEDGKQRQLEVTPTLLPGPDGELIPRIGVGTESLADPAGAVPPEFQVLTPEGAAAVRDRIRSGDGLGDRFAPRTVQGYKHTFGVLGAAQSAAAAPPSPDRLVQAARGFYGAAASSRPDHRGVRVDEFVSGVGSDGSATQLASELHEMWRAGFEAEHGKGASRLKDDGKGGQIDINAPYSTLTPQWQAENLAAATSAIAAARSKMRASGALGEEEALRIREAVADQVHQDWMARNGSWAPAEQMVPYADLPEVEKEKDRVIADRALKAVMSEKGRDRSVVEAALTHQGRPVPLVPDRGDVAGHIAATILFLREQGIEVSDSAEMMARIEYATSLSAASWEERFAVGAAGANSPAAALEIALLESGWTSSNDKDGVAFVDPAKSVAAMAAWVADASERSVMQQLDTGVARHTRLFSDGVAGAGSDTGRERIALSAGVAVIDQNDFYDMRRAAHAISPVVVASAGGGADGSGPGAVNIALFDSLSDQAREQLLSRLSEVDPGGGWFFERRDGRGEVLSRSSRAPQPSPLSDPSAVAGIVSEFQSGVDVAAAASSAPAGWVPPASAGATEDLSRLLWDELRRERMERPAAVRGVSDPAAARALSGLNRRLEDPVAEGVVPLVRRVRDDGTVDSFVSPGSALSYLTRDGRTVVSLGSVLPAGKSPLSAADRGSGPAPGLAPGTSTRVVVQDTAGLFEPERGGDREVGPAEGMLRRVGVAVR